MQEKEFQLAQFKNKTDELISYIRNQNNMIQKLKEKAWKVFYETDKSNNEKVCKNEVLSTSSKLNQAQQIYNQVKNDSIQFDENFVYEI